MKILTLPMLLMLTPSANMPPDSLLVVLDGTVANRAFYTSQKEETIRNLKETAGKLTSLDEIYRMNAQIIRQYESFVCDSAEVWINKNIALAGEMENRKYLTDSRLNLAFVYSLSGLFVQAADLLDELEAQYDTLSIRQKAVYCWHRIRYYENYIKYTADHELSTQYGREIDLMRARLLDLLDPESEEFLKERAFDLQSRGEWAGARDILNGVFSLQQPDTHAYAMAAMSLAKVYRLLGDIEAEDRHLKLAAIADLRFGVKENEALLALALNLFERGDITRSYNYISVALADANFYNSRFRNAVIARVQPVIESNYLSRINRQRRNLIFSVVLVSIFGAGLIVALRVVSRQIRIVSKARLHLRQMNGELIALNRRLGEANIVKEKYIGHFMSRCVTYIDKLDTYRKEINRKVKSGQFDRIYKPSNKELDKEVEELFVNFDAAFFTLYPDFVNQFNKLLVPEARYEQSGRQLNTELRIFALMRLGITNINQIAEFLHCSQQTIYNYRSKMRGRVRQGVGSLEEEVQRLCLFEI